LYNSWFSDWFYFLDGDQPTELSQLAEQELSAASQNTSTSVMSNNTDSTCSDFSVSVEESTASVTEAKDSTSHNSASSSMLQSFSAQLDPHAHHLPVALLHCLVPARTYRDSMINLLRIGLVQFISIIATDPQTQDSFEECQALLMVCFWGAQIFRVSLPFDVSHIVSQFNRFLYFLTFLLFRYWSITLTILR
jgi:hypothetical protein